MDREVVRQNYAFGDVLTEMYTRAEHLQKNTEVKTRSYNFFQPPITAITGNKERDIPSCCTGVVEANFNIIGVAHIGRISRDPK